MCVENVHKSVVDVGSSFGPCVGLERIRCFTLMDSIHMHPCHFQAQLPHIQAWRFTPHSADMSFCLHAPLIITPPKPCSPAASKKLLGGGHRY